MDDNTITKQLKVLEAAVAAIGHNNGSPIDAGEAVEEDGWLTTKAVAERYDVSTRSIERWRADPTMNFPPATKFRKLNLTKLSALNRFDRERDR